MQFRCRHHRSRDDRHHAHAVLIRSSLRFRISGHQERRFAEALISCTGGHRPRKRLVRAVSVKLLYSPVLGPCGARKFRGESMLHDTRVSRAELTQQTCQSIL